MKKDLNTTRLRHSKSKWRSWAIHANAKQDGIDSTPARKRPPRETECNTGHADYIHINPTSSHGNHPFWSNERSNRKDQVGSHSTKSAEIWEVRQKMKQNRRRQKHSTRKTSARWLCVGQAREENKWSTTYEPVFYIVHEINGPRITTRRAIDEWTICRDISHFKFVNAVINSEDDREITEAGESSPAADPSPEKFTSFQRYVEKPAIPLWKDGVDQPPEEGGNFLRCSGKNSTSCNPGKCKELAMRKKGFLEELCKIHNILQCSELKLLVVIFQYNC